MVRLSSRDARWGATGVGSVGTETGRANAASVRAFYLPLSSTMRVRLIKQGIFMIYTISRAENTINVGAQINGAAGHAATSLFWLGDEHFAVLYQQAGCFNQLS